MAILPGTLVVLAALSSSAVPSHQLGVRHQLRPQQPLYSAHQAEFYLTAQQIEYIRPGLNVEVQNVTIPADLHPVVTVKVTDDQGQPLDRSGVLTPGPLSITFLLAWYEPDTRNYHDYSLSSVTGAVSGAVQQPTTDRNGTWQDLGNGVYTYTFATELPSDYPADMTHTVGIYAERDLEDTPVAKTYVTNVEYDFVPAGGPVTDTYDEIQTANCNTCHDPLEAHGGARRDVKLCVMCHADGFVDPDTGNSIDFPVMIHKIHRGADLPSVQAGQPYQIIGYRGSVHDYSDVVFPQDVRNCTVCHGASPAWYTEPSIQCCISCHDNINPETGDGHPGTFSLVGVDCSSCHLPVGEHEFDISIKGAHTIPEKSSQLPGLNVEILDVTNTAPGDNPVITFKITDNAGDFVDPTTLNRFNWQFGGPTTDYARNFSETLKNPECTGDTCVDTLAFTMPADATGTWGFSADVYHFVTIDDLASGIEVREAAFNPLFYAAVTDATPQPRREIVSLAKCNACHDRLALHGGQRMRIEECVLCHNPNGTDESERPAGTGEPASIHFKWMIHRIHQGANLESDYTVYGHGGSANDFSDVRFPGDLRDCQKCHADDSNQLPVPDGALPTQAPRYYFSPVTPNAAACVSCHDSEDAGAHAYTMIAPFAESCPVCHDPQGAFAVDKVHAR